MATLNEQDRIQQDVLSPYERKLEKGRELVTWHYFREPEIRFRLRMKSPRSRNRQKAAVARIGDSLMKQGTITGWHFGNHGEEGPSYAGEEDRYGRNGWKVAQRYFRNGSETALALLELKRESKLESPLWAKGLGNPWEGGKRNPWRERVEDPLVFHWSRAVHLLTNQLGFDMEKEVQLCSKQAQRYRRVMKFGMRW